jgi:hypothetical protein
MIGRKNTGKKEGKHVKDVPSKLIVSSTSLEPILDLGRNPRSDFMTLINGTCDLVLATCFCKPHTWWKPWPQGAVGNSEIGTRAHDGFEGPALPEGGAEHVWVISSIPEVNLTGKVKCKSTGSEGSVWILSCYERISGGAGFSRPRLRRVTVVSYFPNTTLTSRLKYAEPGCVYHFTTEVSASDGSITGLAHDRRDQLVPAVFVQYIENAGTLGLSVPEIVSHQVLAPVTTEGLVPQTA